MLEENDVYFFYRESADNFFSGFRFLWVAREEEQARIYTVSDLVIIKNVYIVMLRRYVAPMLWYPEPVKVKVKAVKVKVAGVN